MSEKNIEDNIGDLASLGMLLPGTGFSYWGFFIFLIIMLISMKDGINQLYIIMK